MRTIVFIDFWNFQLNWNNRTGKAPCDWTHLGPELLGKVQGMLTPMGLGPARLEGVRLYASTLRGDPAGTKMVAWMNQTLKRLPGWSVSIRERALRAKLFHCRECNQDFDTCPRCGKPLRHAPEKGVDAAIVSDMLTLGWEGCYDLAVLVTQDADFVPGVHALQTKGIKVINASWAKGGNDLQQACWGAFPLEDLIPALTR